MDVVPMPRHSKRVSEKRKARALAQATMWIEVEAGAVRVLQHSKRALEKEKSRAFAPMMRPLALVAVPMQAHSNRASRNGKTRAFVQEPAEGEVAGMLVRSNRA